MHLLLLLHLYTEDFNNPFSFWVQSLHKQLYYHRSPHILHNTYRLRIPNIIEPVCCTYNLLLLNKIYIFNCLKYLNTYVKYMDAPATYRWWVLVNLGLPIYLQLFQSTFWLKTWKLTLKIIIERVHRFLTKISTDETLSI